MKLFIASDIHGSAHYTKLMLELYKETKAERLLLLGDILYHDQEMICQQNTIPNL